MPDPQSLSQRKTKIIATVGPACDDVATLEDMIHAGLNVVRLNLSHGDYESHANRVAQVRQAASNVGAHVAIMVDTKGIEVRTGLLEDGPVFLEADQTFTLFADDRKGNLAGVSVSYRKLSAGVKKGDVILLDDGAIELSVAAVNAAAIECVVVHGGMLGERKGVNLPGAQLAISAISPEFLENLENEIDFAVAQQV
ncbi:MAG TPA: pyruvate kinase, partial [Gammaproteobacteria bacterium]|nr:pyruvate kinase [Gammaproteobacteria bacterium]